MNFLPKSATKVFAETLKYQPTNISAKDCGLCGRHEPAKYWKDVLKDTFSGRSELNSEWICWACEICINDKRTRSNIIIINKAYHKPFRKEIWPFLFNPPKPQWLIYLTLSGKKHGLWRQHIAISNTRFKLQCEDYACMFSPSKDSKWMTAAANLVLEGAQRSSTQNGKYNSTDYYRVGKKRLCELEKIIQPIRHSQKWAIVFGLMPGKDDLKEVLNARISY
jgi:hypothetical protein